MPVLCLQGQPSGTPASPRGQASGRRAAPSTHAARTGGRLRLKAHFHACSLQGRASGCRAAPFSCTMPVLCLLGQRSAPPASPQGRAGSMGHSFTTCRPWNSIRTWSFLVAGPPRPPEAPLGLTASAACPKELVGQTHPPNHCRKNRYTVLPAGVGNDLYHR